MHHFKATEKLSNSIKNKLNFKQLHTRLIKKILATTVNLC
jgi:hypothetical protein